MMAGRDLQGTVRTDRRQSAGWAARLALLSGVAVLGYACSDPLGPEQEALNTNRAAWAAASIADYRYSVREFCFCGPETLRPVAIEVREGRIVSAMYEDDGTTVVEPRLSQLRTVEGLFAVIQDAIDREAHSLEATYDPLLGYPTSVQIDYIELAVDEEYGFESSGLTPIEGG